VLVVMGPHWIDVRRDDGVRRLDDPADYVRREIELALESDALLVPVLVEDAASPKAEQLPASIRALHTRNAIELSHKRWQVDTEGLIELLEKRGVAPRASGDTHLAEPSRERPMESSAARRDVLQAITRFLPDLFSAARHPRRFLRQRARGRGTDLAAAFVFFVLAVCCAVAITLAQYDPMDSAIGLGLAALVAGLIATLVFSLPLWIGWRLVGAKRHYGKLLVVLLYQSGLLHIVWSFVMVIVFFGLDMGSRRFVSDVMAELMRPGQSTRAGWDAMLPRIGPLVETPEVRVALLAAFLVVLAGGAWLVASWGAYRDAFGLGRLRSLAALILAGLVLWAGATAIELIY
jgi:hypothetical protein